MEYMLGCLPEKLGDVTNFNYVKSAERVSGFFRRRMNNNAIIHCEFCNTEHTGRNAYSIGVFLYLYVETGKEEYWNLAYTVARRTMHRLEPDPLHGALVFMPGNHEGANQSNTVIDAGICTDMVSTFLSVSKQMGNNVYEADEWEKRLNIHIDQYLSAAVLEKQCLNQRAWGLTGIASYYRLTGKKELYKLIVKAVDELFALQNSDGSFNYMMNRVDDDPSTWFSVYYFPRLLSFLLYSAESVDKIGEYQDNILRAATLLIDCHDYAGAKLMPLEIKKWYFTSEYEMGSACFDLNFLRAVADRFAWGCSGLIDLIENEYLKHVKEDGVVSNLDKAPNVLCSFVENSDFIWFLRSKKFQDVPTAGYEQESRAYPDAGLRMEVGEDGKVIHLVNRYISSLAWGASNGTVVEVTPAGVDVSKPGVRFFKLLHLSFWKRSVRDIKMMLYASRCNLRFLGWQSRYFSRIISKL